MPAATTPDARLHAEVAAHRHLRLDALMRAVFTDDDHSNPAIDRPGQPTPTHLTLVPNSGTPPPNPTETP